MSVILVVEDDTNLRASLVAYLSGEGHRVIEAADVATAKEKIGEHPDLVIMDWRLPDGQGINLLKEWRLERRETPIILLTARADIVDKVLGLEVGANDYVTKPFEPRELLARVAVQLRTRVSAAPTAPKDLLLRRGIGLTLSRREVTFHGEAIELTKMEFDLLRVLIESPGQVFSRDELLNRVWGYDAYPTTRTVDTHILALRNKLDGDLFETVRGIGYRFVDKDLTKNRQRVGAAMTSPTRASVKVSASVNTHKETVT